MGADQPLFRSVSGQQEAGSNNKGSTYSDAIRKSEFRQVEVELNTGLSKHSRSTLIETHVA
jgi:hypothetical protein